MNIIFMRHGEAVDNIKEVFSDKEIYWSVLTNEGKKVVKDSLKKLPDKIDKIYVSPLPRTIETAHYVYEKYYPVDVIIEKRLHEINYGKYSGKKNNEELDKTRLKQIDGDYFIRFGQYGENKYEIENRLCDFMCDVFNNNLKDNTILIVAHGSIISYIKRILNIKSSHIKTGAFEKFYDVDFSFLFERIKILQKVKRNVINRRLTLIKELKVNKKLKNNLIKMVKNEFNNIEFSDEYFNYYISGITTNNLIKKTNPKFDNDVILVCFYNNFENLAEKWINHYINIGIKNYVLINNNSSDNSTRILENYSNKINISFWEINDDYNCFKMCGWKQKIMEYYGEYQYLIVDSDELFIYKDYDKILFKDYVKTNNVKLMKSIMLDVYGKKSLFDNVLDDYIYVDKGTYKIDSNVPYKQRIFGGPRSRLFGINPSLQKIPFITYNREVYANDHYLYPWYLNNKAKISSYLLHYKFLPEDKEKYKKFVLDGRHWNDSHEYKVYDNVLRNNEKLIFYDKDISIEIENMDFIFN